MDAVNNLSYQATITNNTNGTVKGLNITDGFYAADSQNCTFTYDDLSRLLTHNCGTVWGAAYSYDAYGNISKGMISGSPGTTFAPTYSATTNRFATIPSGTLSYDSAGNLTSDGFHTYGWDSDGNLISVGGIAGTFDALDRRVEVNNAGTYQQMLYPPFAPTFQMSLAQGLTAENIRIPLPGGGQAIYNSSGLAQYRHPNWQGSEVVLSWPGGTPNPNVGGAFTAFGEKYAIYPGGYNGYFAGMLGIADEGPIADAYQATARLYHQDEGRWVSPDPAGLSAVDLSNPQSWNRYAYALNNPLSFMDPSGLCSQDSSGGYWDSNDAGTYLYDGSCNGGGGTPTVTSPGVTVTATPLPNDFYDSSVDPGQFLSGFYGLTFFGNPFASGGASGANGAQSSPCGGTANKGYGFGFLASAGAFFGLGRGAAASGSAGVGYFHTDTHYGSGNMLGGFKGGGAFTVPSQNPPSNLAVGFQAGAGAGIFFTNAGNAQSMGGPGTAYQVSVPFFSIEYDTSPGGIWAISFTGGEGKGLQAGFLKIQTNSKGATFTCGAPY